MKPLLRILVAAGLLFPAIGLAGSRPITFPGKDCSFYVRHAGQYLINVVVDSSAPLTPEDAEREMQSYDARVRRIVGRFAELGFALRFYPNVMIETVQGSTICYYQRDGQTVGGRLPAPVVIPPGAGAVFWGCDNDPYTWAHWDPQAPPGGVPPASLVFPKNHEDVTSEGIDFQLAHELAHLTSLPQNTPWDEARANMLAYLATGQTKVDIVRHVPREQFDEQGNPYTLLDSLVVDLDHPLVTHVSKLAPRVSASHFNSEIMASLLTRMVRRFGPASAAGFIRWLDHNYPFPDLSAHGTESIEAQRAIVLNHVQRWAAHLREYASLVHYYGYHPPGFTHQTAAWIESELMKLGLGVPSAPPAYPVWRQWNHPYVNPYVYPVLVPTYGLPGMVWPFWPPFR
jgi:hypothetical protein